MARFADQQFNSMLTKQTHCNQHRNFKYARKNGPCKGFKKLFLESEDSPESDRPTRSDDSDPTKISNDLRKDRRLLATKHWIDAC